MLCESIWRRYCEFWPDVLVIILLGLAAVTTKGFTQARPTVAQAFSSAACPVMVKAKYTPAARLLLVPDQQNAAQHPLRLDFEPTVSRVVVQAQITVRGISSEGGVIPAQSVQVTSRKNPWLTHTFRVNTTVDASGSASATLWLTGFGGVGSVRIDSLIYADGSTWQSGSGSECYAATGMTFTAAN